MSLTGTSRKHVVISFLSLSIIVVLFIGFNYTLEIDTKRKRGRFTSSTFFEVSPNTQQS